MVLPVCDKEQRQEQKHHTIKALHLLPSLLYYSIKK